MTILNLKGRDVPPSFKGWIEKRAGRKVLKSEQITMWVMKATSKKESSKIQEQWDRERKSRKRRLAHVANKMLEAGLSKADADIVRHDGW